MLMVAVVPCPGVLPELDALASLLEANDEWEQDASAVRARMLNILQDVADRYQSLGARLP